MKKLAFLLVSILLTTCFYGQENNRYDQESKIQLRTFYQGDDIVDEFDQRIEAYMHFRVEMAENKAIHDKLHESKWLLDSILSYNYDIYGDSVISRKSTYTRNSTGNITSILSYNWIENPPNPGIWELSTKTEYTYDDQDRAILHMYYTWEENHWQEWSRRIFDYDDFGNTILNAEYNWDLGLNQWVGISKFEYSYNENGLRLMNSYYYWNLGINDWIGMYKYEYIYDSNDLLITDYSYGWSASDNWILEFKTDCSYDENNLQILDLTYTWEEENWELFRKIEYSYNEDGNNVLYLSSLWLYDDVWENNAKSEYDYDQNGNRIMSAYYSWENESWVGSYKSISEYDENSNLIFLYRYSWDYQIADWRGVNKYAFTYDENGYENSYAYYHWDPALEQWIGGFKDTYDSDEDGNILVYISHYWDEGSNAWIMDRKSFYYYFDFYSGISESNTLESLVFPNPFHNNITLDITLENTAVVTISIYDIKGKIIQNILRESRNSVSYRVTLSLPHLPPGVYFYCVTAGNTTVTGKMLKVR